ncbi:MAG: hypothetical protein IPK24_11180 [Kineosporiaceae bacterium]|nr:hypothetical protein [Kineosporiaceae bacterium]
MENILRKLLGYVWRHLANKEVIGLLVVFVPAISYSLLYVAYFQFYSFFGLRPADVGLDRTRLLQESLLGPFVFPLGVLVVHWQPALLLLVALAVMSAIGGVGNGLGSAALREAPAGAALGLIVIWAASAVYGYGYLVVESNRLGREVFEQGRVLPSLVLSDPSSGLYMPPHRRSGAVCASDCARWARSAPGDLALIRLHTNVTVNSHLGHCLTHPCAICGVDDRGVGARRYDGGEGAILCGLFDRSRAHRDDVRALLMCATRRS